MSISVEVVGMAELLNELSQYDFRTQDLAEAAVTAATQDALDASLPLIPVLTGYLKSRQQIRSAGGPGFPMMELFNDAEYAAFVCYGHHTRSGSWVPPQDFMTAPLLVGQQSLQQRLIAILG